VLQFAQALCNVQRRSVLRTLQASHDLWMRSHSQRITAAA
jgi:hypothetical protein